MDLIEEYHWIEDRPALCGVLSHWLQDVAQFALSLRHILAFAHLSQ